MEIDLCRSFPAWTPLAIRRERAGEVFRLLRRMTTWNAKHVTETGGKTGSGTGGTERRLKKGEEIIIKNGKQVLRRPAGDNWF